MDINLILIIADGALVVAVAIIWFLVTSVKEGRAHLSAENAELRRSIEALQSEIGQLKTEKSEARPAPSDPRPYIPPTGLSTDRRAEALEMLRHGVNAGTVSATLRLSQAETTLLEKVQGMMSPADQPG
ncbi:MAG TPA: hypothetical protein VK776_02955 [Bryobacteraceae bacterium]|jgi:hypothetical protein|nr:hypothetical protein [Bryobacteraceae bacterium]